MDRDKQQFLADLVARHSAALEKYLARKLDNPDDAAEIAQEAFLRLHRLEQPASLDNARAFLYQVATNLALDHLRRRQLHFRFLNQEQSTGGLANPDEGRTDGVSPEQIVAARQRLEAIERALDELPFKARQAFLLHRRSGMSYSEIAEQLGVSVSSVEKYILQALKHCRARLGSDQSGPKK